jgi:enterochelin esterase-like enzyme
VRSQTFDSPYLQHFYIYLPPCYAEDAPRRYPSLYLIHGQIYTDDQWLRLGTSAIADALIANEEIPPMILIFPYDKVSWKLPEEDGFGTVLVDDLLPSIEAEYRVLPEREQRGIGGISRGGGWAIHDAVFYPSTFGVLGGHSPALFYPDKLEIQSWANETSFPRPRIYLDIGDADTLRRSVEDFETLLTQNGIPHEWHLYIGAHEETYWQAHIEEYLRWYGAAFAEESP